MRGLAAGEHEGVNQGCDSVDTHAGMNRIDVKELDGTELRIPPLLLLLSLHPIYVPNPWLGVWTEALSSTKRRYAGGEQTCRKDLVFRWGLCLKVWFMDQQRWLGAC